MQFVADGPDVPDDLLRAHEDGRVVFFCGAGVSMPAGLPSFEGLVERVYKELCPRLSLKAAIAQPEKMALERKHYDTVFDLLVRRLPGGREDVLRAVAKVLQQPDLSHDEATATHAALLELARDRESQTRLVTTNFDRLFENAKDGIAPQVPSFQAPHLPSPKASQWNGIVYLHGLLPTELNEAP